MFGQSTTGPFGQQNAFGTTRWSTFGSAFNSQPQQQGYSPFTQPSLFGNQSNYGPFGTASNTNQPTSIFGSPAASSFNNAGASIFGNNNNNNKSRDFGSSFLSAFGLTPGTTVKFSAPLDIEQVPNSGNSFFNSKSTINMRMQCITAMPQYKGKSLEELRLEDYNDNRKGPQEQQQSNSIFGSAPKRSDNSFFGSSTNTFGSSGDDGLFSQNKRSAFGSFEPTSSTTSSFFGSNNNNFNNNANNSSSIFGRPSPFANPNPFAQSNNAFGTSAFASSSPFGATMNSQPQQQNALFGTSSNTLFGNNNMNQPSSIFGTATSGQANPFASSIFGSNNVNDNNNPPALFGQNATTNIFGSQPNAFGNSTLFGTFNSQPQQGILFGQTPTNSIFSMNPAQPLFGAANNNSFGSFAPATNTGNIFGSNFNNNTNQQPTLFGQNAITNIFGGQPNAFGSPTQQPPFDPFNQPQPQQNFTDQNSPPPLNFDSDRLITQLQTLPYGMPQPLLTDNTPPPRRITPTFIADPKTLHKYKINATSPELKVERVPSTGKQSVAFLFEGLDDDESTDKLKYVQDIFCPRENIKKLILNKGHTSLFKRSSTSAIILPPPDKGTETAATASNNEENHHSPQMNTSLMSKETNTLDNTIDVINKLTSEAKPDDVNTSTDSSSAEKLAPTPEQQDANSTASTEEEYFETSSSYIPKCGIILDRTDYYTIPSIEECDAYYDAENDTCIVESFTVGRVDYGSIYWNGPLNVKGLNLDEIVHIGRKEVIVYSDDDDDKPPLGEGLNRPAQVTLDQVWPIDKTTRKTIKDLAHLRDLKYPEKVEAATIKMDAIFKEYRPDTGSWVFDVKHF